MQITMKDIIDEGFEIIEEVYGAKICKVKLQIKKN